MNALAKMETTALAVMDEAELMTVLQSSLYPGASHASIKLVLGYCKAAGLDPMQKPVHIVPMWDSKASSMRDVVMPGVGLYRTQAARTGRFAGQTEPEFGPMITESLGGQQITYPEWARVTVIKQMDNGSEAKFTAKEFWIENYAVRGGKEKSIAPNAMWTKRPRGQIGKCAAAQALRLAFPEMGAQPTAEEMEGKPMDHGEIGKADVLAPEIPPSLLKESQDAADKGAKAYQDFWTATGKENRNVLKTVHDANKERAAAADKARTVENTPKPEAKPEGTSASPDTNPAPFVTYACVMDNMLKAKTEDALSVAADWIGEVAAPDQRAELSSKYEALLATMRGAS